MVNEEGGGGGDFSIAERVNTFSLWRKSLDVCERIFFGTNRGSRVRVYGFSLHTSTRLASNWSWGKDVKRHHRMDGCLYFMHVRSFPLIICLWCCQHSSWKLSYPHRFTNHAPYQPSPSSFKSRQSNHCMMSLTFLKINQNMFLIDLGSNTNLEWLGICTYAINDWWAYTYHMPLLWTVGVIFQAPA